MDSKGYEAITNALDAEHINALVGPRPTPEQHLPYVTVSYEGNIIPAHVLNILGKAGLLHTDGGTTRGYPIGPKLKSEFGMPGSITFRDMNNGH